MTDNTQKAQGSGEVDWLRCPFCASISVGPVGSGKFIQCASCGAEGPKIGRDPAKSWNLRLSQPPEASEVEAVAYLKFWWDGQSPRTRVDLSEICEPWLDALKPTITPLYAHPPKAMQDVKRIEDGHADTEGETLERMEHLNCPSCGGSGHIDDVSKVEVSALREALELLARVKSETFGGPVAGGDGNTFIVRTLTGKTLNDITALLALAQPAPEQGEG